MNPDFSPVLLGADLNCYHMARAFSEAFGVESDAFGKYPLAVTASARCIRFHTVPALSDPDTLVSVLNTHAKARGGSGKRLVIGCTDEYALLLAREKERLAEYYEVPYADAALIARLTGKARFAKYAAEYRIPHPRTVIYRCDTPLTPPPFGYPVIVKPSDSARYWQHPFPGMRKVYLAHDPGELYHSLRSVFSGGYPGEAIVQEYLPGGDDASYVLTTYSGRDGKVAAACFGHVLLEEHTPTGTGNHVAILTGSDPGVVAPIRALLEGEGYVGFANFDLRYDPHTGRYAVLELNARQGRSNYYLTAAGVNPARLLVADYLTGEPLPGGEGKSGVYWSCVPDAVVLRSLPDPLKVQVKDAIAAGRVARSFDCRQDLRRNPRRRFWVFAHALRYYGKYRRTAERKGEERFATV